MDSLSDKERKKIYWVLKIVQEREPVPIRYLKKLVDTAGLWEVRAEYAGQAFRLLGFFDGPLLVILTNAFSKKTAHTPLSEIQIAQERRRDYLMRKGKR
ncbi:MAG TPA: type II toxin-antitoxin system RelE/ParE family toxin [Longimicrobium sp.]|jgi:phage-related protein|uniref:type II toxin-antitoxin system RelE/ParE family toxin n=1 Tax=Longimicrobium sp. TaxID=2029185 RepID=UPI002ED96AA1